MMTRTKHSLPRFTQHAFRRRWTRSKYFWLIFILAFIMTAWLFSNRALIIGYAQSGIDPDTDPYSDPLATISDVPERVDDDAINLQEAIKMLQETQRLLDFQDFVDRTLGPMTAEHGSDAFDMDSPPTRFFARAPLNAVSGDRFSTNAYGANFSVPHGSYKGDGLVGLDELWTLNSHGGITPVNRDITRGRPGDRSISGGWSFEPGGFLKETYETINVDHTEPKVTRCSVVLRYSYASRNSGSRFQQRGVEQAQTFYVDSDLWEADLCAAAARDHFTGPLPTQFWSNDGQIALDMSDRNRPVMLYPDGTIVTLALPAGTAVNTAYIPYNEGLRDSMRSGQFIDGLWYISQNITRNGNITTYGYNANGWVTSVTDFRGRQTIFERDSTGLVKSVTAPGPGGSSLKWQMTWATHSWNPRDTFPDIICLSSGQATQCADTASYTTLETLQLPDLRSYSFSYGPWGNLATVAEPDGAVKEFRYGNQNTPAFMPPGYSFGNFPIYTLNLQRRRVTRTTIYPQGLSGPSLITTIEHDSTQDLGSGAQCPTLGWIKHNYPNGDFERKALCNQMGGHLDGQTFAQELWRGSTLLSGTYYGNLGTFGDTSTPIGSMYLDWETASDASHLEDNPSFLDIRPTKIVHLKEGVTWTENSKYEQSEIPANPECSGCSTYRTTGNVTDKKIRDDSGALLSKVLTSYFHNGRPPYINRNLLRLPLSVILQDGSALEITRTEYTYDEYAVDPSFAPNLDPNTTSIRGNETSMKGYLENPQNTSISSHKYYFDTGDVKRALDPLGHPTMMAYDFGPCSAAHTRLTSSVTNVLGHTTTTTNDCFTGAPLRVIDPNDQSIYTQYDDLGRAVETASAGDTLTALPQAVPGATPSPDFRKFVRDPNAPVSNGIIVGNNGQGPTSWMEYLSPGVINNQRIVVHTKDGTSDGHYGKTFLDGLGRTTQTRSEVDPTTSGGNSENVTTIEYDNMGHVSTSYVPCFSSQSDAFAPCTTLGTTTQYDALGRVTMVTPPGLPATNNYYSALGAKWLTTVVDANGHQSAVVTDVLGHTVKTSRSWVEGGKMACSDPELGMLQCATTMDYDAAGRLKSIIDPGGNIMSFIYDGLGRKTDMTDPDMGHWHYEYDDNGNLISQTDAKGQVITMQYDALNRIILKDLPPAGAGEEDITYSYDGDQPSTCYSCDDHDTSTQDCCDPATGTCYHPAAGTPCGTICTYSLSAPSATFPASGGNSSVTVTTGPTCSWTATTTATWIHINNTSGTGTGPVNYSVDANPGAARSGPMTIGGQPFTVNQDALSCTYSLSAPSATFPASGGNGSVTVTTGPTCSWAATTATTWIHINNASGTGTGPVNYSVDANTGAARSGTINISGQTFTVNQVVGCTYSLSAPSATFPASGGNGSVTVTTGATCSWAATTAATWIHINNASGTGTGPINYSVDANTGAARSGTINISGQTFTVNQLVGCTYSLSAPSAIFPASGGNGSVTVTTGATCSWIATTAATWIHINNSSGTGTGPVNYSVDANTGAARSGTMNIGGQTFTVNQAAACTYSISPTENLSLPPAGVTGAQVTVTSNCAWTAASNAAWIVITGGNSGSGNGTVTYNVQPNPGTATRYGSMTIAGLYFNVSQDACSYFIQPTNEAFSYTSTQSSVQVSVQGGCNWSAVSNAPWITINSGSSGSGSGTVLYTIAANTSTTWPTSRTGTMTIAGQTFTATQAGQPTCPNSSGLSCDPIGFQGCTGKCFQSSGGSSTVYVWLSRTDCDWYPRVNVPWVHITSVTDNGSNPRVVNYSVDANASAPTRLGVITINGLAFKVSEGGTSSSASGRVTTASGQGLAGVTITFSALTPYPGLPAAVVTDANGYWSQSGFVVCKGNWATATKSGYTFSPNKNGFNPGAVNVDFLAMPSQGSYGARFESTARTASVFSALSPRVAESTGATREASINDQKQAANDRSLPHDPTGFALLGCLAAVFVVRLYRLRQRP